MAALLSVLTAAALWRSLPRILALPSPQQVLRASEVAWRETFESAAVGIAHTAPDGRWLRFNEALCRITGYSRAELKATTFQAITYSEDLAQGAALTAQLAAGEIRAFSIEKRYLRKDGTLVWVNLTVSLHRIHLPREESYFIAMVQDITASKKAEEGRREAEALFRTLTEGMPSMAWVRRHDGLYEYLNPQWHAYTGWTEEDLATRGHFELIHPEDLPTMIELHQASILTGEGHFVEFRHRRHDGAWRWTESRVAPVRDAQGNVLRWVGTLTDIHDQRQERERLLENERAARNEAEEASRLKDEFLAIVSHELRTPLSAILGWSQLLLVPKIAEAELQRGLETIRRNARSQAQIIDDLLDMSRIITGKIRLDIRTVDLPQILEKALDSVRPAAMAKGVRIETLIHPSLPPAKGDPGRLQQILWNLFSNAIRFTPQGGTVQVASERVGSHLEVTVSDTGEGIDPEFLPYVFDRFRQQDGSTARAHGGLGLGLSIVKNLVELHGGEIRASSAGLGERLDVHLSASLEPRRPGRGTGEPEGRRRGPVRGAGRSIARRPQDPRRGRRARYPRGPAEAPRVGRGAGSARGLGARSAGALAAGKAAPPDQRHRNAARGRLLVDPAGARPRSRGRRRHPGGGPHGSGSRRGPPPRPPRRLPGAHRQTGRDRGADLRRGGSGRSYGETAPGIAACR